MKILVVCHPRKEERMHPVTNFTNILSKFSKVFLIHFNPENISPNDNFAIYKFKSIFPTSENLLLRIARFSTNLILMNLITYRVSKRNNVDIIIPFGAKIYSVFGSFFAIRFLNSKLIIRDSGTNISQNSIIRLLEKFLYLKSDGIICLSDKEAKYIRSIVKSKALISINQGIDLNLFNPRFVKVPIKFEKKSENYEFIFIFVGTLIKDKGIYNLINAFELLKNEKYLLLIVGNGPDKNIIKKIILNKNLSNNVILISRVPHIHMPEYYKLADALILPSFHEGLPNVILEALAMEIPVLASDVGGISDYVIDGKTGFLLRRVDVESLFQKMYDILSLSKVDRINMGKMGREIVAEKCSFKKVEIKIHEFLNNIG